ncbi:hypothetical protein BDZ89DRAFT_1069489 [Hymenopellis radicata]|nr:hypothetical protein BDZ89DRAFT_1069489 [Hymenopellis radicata]
MYFPSAGDRLRIAVALCALKHKPEGQAIDSYALDLKGWARGDEDQRSKDWRALALSLEEQLRDLRADDLQRDKPSNKRGKQPRAPSPTPAPLPPPPPTSDLPCILTRALTASLSSSSKLDTLNTRLVPDMAFALVDGILYPALKAFLKLSTDALKFTADSSDSRPALLRLVQRALSLLDSDARKEIGLAAIAVLTGDPEVDYLARKDAFWYLCTVISLCDLGQRGAEALCKILEQGERLSVVEREMVEGVLERIWLSMDDEH